MLLRLTLKDLAARKRRLASMAMAIVIGIAFLSGTFVLTDTVRHTIDGLLADGNAGTDAFVRGPTSLDVGLAGGRPQIPADLAPRVAAVAGVDAVAPRIQGYAQVVGTDGRPVGDQAHGAPLIGQNWIVDQRLNPFRLASGRAPTGDAEIVVDRGTAHDGHLAVGDRVTVLSAADPITAEVVGIARFGSADSMGGIHSVLFTDGTAQRLLSQPGLVDGIAVVARPDVSPAELAQRISTTLNASGAGAAWGPGSATASGAGSPAVEVITGTALTREVQSTIHEDFAPFNLFLLIFAGIAVFVAAFIINNTFSIVVSQRTRELGLRRALGASRSQVLTAVVAEAVVIGAAASAVGLGAGVLLARGLKAVMDAIGFAVPAGSPVMETRTVVASLVTGLGVTVASAVLPARRASRIAPIAALRDGAVDASSTSRTRMAVGATVTGGGAAALAAGLSTPSARLVGLGAAGVFLGVSVLAPVLVRPVVAVAGLPLRRLGGVTGRLSSENARRNPKRTARTAAALMIGVALVGFVTILATSITASIGGSIDRDFRGNLVVDSGSFDGTGGLSPELATQLRTTPGVTAAVATRAVPARVDGAKVAILTGWDTADLARVFDLGQIQGSLASLGTDGLAVDARRAADKGWHLGDTVPVTLADGVHPFTVRAVFDHGSQWVGKEFVGTGALPRQLDSRIYLVATDRASVAGMAGRYPAAQLLDKKALADDASKEINQLLGLIYTLLALAVVIALIGIANTLSLSIHERTRELGLLRAVGTLRSQLRWLVRGEAALIALFGALLGLTVGTFFGWAMVKALAGQGIDRLVVPAGSLAVVFVIAGLAGVAAALLPSRRAARLDVLQALSMS